MSISPKRIRALDLVEPPGAGRPAHLSAASSLVRVGNFLYVVADDEHHLGVFGAAGEGAGTLIRLFDGDLPESRSKRKKKKPDVEALVRLPPFARFPHGALFALGSGSKPNRRRGVLLGLGPDGAANGEPVVVDLSPMFVPLDDEFPKLNIEGAVVVGDELHLLQRGNKRAGNALIRFRLAEVHDLLRRGDRSGPLRASAIQRVELGEINGVPLCFTDAAALPGGGMVFTAVAEDTGDSVSDGPCEGAALGMLGPEGRLRCLDRLDRAHKIEGIDARVEGDTVRLLLVTDADDASVPAELFSTEMPMCEDAR